LHIATQRQSDRHRLPLAATHARTAPEAACCLDQLGLFDRRATCGTTGTPTGEPPAQVKSPGLSRSFFLRRCCRVASLSSLWLRIGENVGAVRPVPVIAGPRQRGFLHKPQLAAAPGQHPQGTAAASTTTAARPRHQTRAAHSHQVQPATGACVTPPRTKGQAHGNAAAHP
jgi:hypothetical protein